MPNEWPDDCEFGLTFIRPVRTRSILHKNIYGHNGWGGCKFWMYPDEGVAFVLMTNFIGGETDREAIQLSDDELTAIVHQDLQTVLGITGAPHRLPITRWQSAIPQYNLGHAARVATIEAVLARRTGLWLAGNYLHGVALGDCLKRGKEIADQVARASE